MKVVFISAVMLIALGGVPGPARADGAARVSPAPTARPTLSLHGYGELHAAFLAYGPDQNRAGGSQRDRRLELDTTRLVLALEAEFPGRVEVEAEIEFEHGGTGAAMELEYDEFGEFEQEIGKGGEVLVEELKLRKALGEHVALSAGRFYVAVGTLSRYHRPTAYLGTARSEGETTVIPQVWNEMGVQAELFFGAARITAQLVNGLDSTGFSSQRWVTGGHQARFETIRASDLAAVLRVDVQPIAGLEVGASGYAGGTSRNRPKPDLVPDCPASEREVAPCGYVSAPVLIADVHAAMAIAGVRVNALALIGWLRNADDISARNDRLSNDLNVARTPVSDRALSLWAEAGYDVAPHLRLGDAHRLEPFVRVERYDTMFRPRDDLFDNPRFERTVLSAGISYQFHGGVFAKLDGSRRSFGSAGLRVEHALRAAGGFVF